MSANTSIQQKERVSIATYNCIGTEYYSYFNNLTPSQKAYAQGSEFHPKKLQHVIDRILKLNADVVCVQEIPPRCAPLFIDKMSKLGYDGVYARFETMYYDGVATFFRHDKFKEFRQQVVPYQDNTNRIALFLHLKTAQGVEFDVANTQLQDGDDDSIIAKTNAQIQKLVHKVHQFANPVIVCGDMNFTPQDARFQAMNQSLSDALNGQPIPTFLKAGTGAVRDPVRQDYIWHSRSISSTSPSVPGDLQKCLSPEEPSLHVPVMAAFDFEIPPSSQLVSSSGLKTRNNYPEAAKALFSRWRVFEAFNEAMRRMPASQTKYDEYAARLEKMIETVCLSKLPSGEALVAQLYTEIAFKAKTGEEASFLTQVLSSLTGVPEIMDVIHPDPTDPSNMVFARLRKLFLNQSAKFPGLYDPLSQYFSECLTIAEQMRRQEGADFFSILAGTIHNLAPGFAQDLLMEVIEPFKPSETVILIKCKDIPIDQDLFIRGSGEELNWSHGVKLVRIDAETFGFKIKARFSGELEYKLLLNDDSSRWEEGPNRKISVGKRIECTPSFPVSMLPPLKRTVIEVNFAMPPGKTLSISGTGPLGNWDRKVELKPKGKSTTQWLSLDGEIPAFEYKFRIDDVWETGPNRQAESGKKAEVRSPIFL